MRVLAYVIAGFYSLECFASGSSEVPEKNATTSGGLFTFLTSKNIHNEKEIYFETTQYSVHEAPAKSFQGDLLKPVPVISDPLFEDGVWNVSAVKELTRKRHIQQRGFTHDQKMMLLQLHNLYRSNVTPPAGNMAYMEWDDELARLAQIWSDGCIFDHGMPDNDYPETIGQNLYIGTDPTGYLGLYLWFEEYHHYDLHNDYCLPGKQCGHYVQMAWYLSNRLGCGMTKCGMRYLMTCHYSPQALKGTQMYRVAKPCSQCPSKKGSLCLRNLCMTSEQCQNNPFECQFAECNLECHNCGHLNKEKCLCECADGWDSPDCSSICTDKHKRCGVSPGWPTKASCSMNQYSVAEYFCRKMCDTCNTVNISVSNNTCCGGMLCDEGFVLDMHENSCKCKLLCPSSMCDSKDSRYLQAALGSNAINLNSFFASWMFVFITSKKMLWNYLYANHLM